MPPVCKIFLLVIIAIALVGCDETERHAESANASRNNRMPLQPEHVVNSAISAAAQVEAGKILHSRILDRYPQLDTSYRKASLWGALSNQPIALVCVPESDWQSLSKDEQESLGAYAASCVDVVRRSPLKYSGLPSTAPAASAIRGKAAAMTAESWGIMTGMVSTDGVDIAADHISLKGK